MTTVNVSEMLAAMAKLRPAFGGSASRGESSSLVRLSPRPDGTLGVAVQGSRLSLSYMAASTSVPTGLTPALNEPVAVSYRALREMLVATEAGTKGEAMLALDDNRRLRIAVGRSFFSLPTWSGNDLAAVTVAPPFHDNQSVVWDAPALRDRVRFVLPSASNDDARPILATVMLGEAAGGLEVVATDSYRLAVASSTDPAPPHQILVPWQGASVLPAEATPITIYGEPNVRGLGWSSDGVDWVVGTQAGEFPNYRGLIPSPRSGGFALEARFETSAAVSVIRRASIFQKVVGEINTPVRIVSDADERAGLLVGLSAPGGGIFEDFIPCEFEGRPRDFTVAFNPSYLLDGLRSMSAPVLNLAAIDAQKPVVLSTEARLYLLMPVRIS